MSELSEAISEMRNMRESYDQIGAAAEAYNTGKAELAANITAKGVQASATETLPELAEKVAAISQDTYEINGGEMYAKQLFGSLETPDYWNLYDILEQLLSDGRLVNYGGILLAEYYKGYDSLALSGAGAGGAYVVSDKDSNGNFIMYTEDTTHTWDTAFDGKGNRWVAYCFADEYHDFQITDTNTSPRSIFIGRKVGTIKLLTNSRTSKVVVPDGNELVCYDPNGYTPNFQQDIVLKGLQNQTATISYNNTGFVGEKLYMSMKKFNGRIFNSNGTGRTFSSISSIIIQCEEWGSGAILQNCSAANAVLAIDGVRTGEIKLTDRTFGGLFPQIKNLSITNSDCSEIYALTINSIPSQCEVYVEYGSNSGIFTFSGGGFGTSCLKLQSGWNKGLDAHVLSNLTEANMYAYILQRLKQDEADCGDGVTITLGATNLAKLTSEESVQLLDDLTNIYGYTFA